MRLPLIAPAQLTPEQKALFDRNRKSISNGFTSFTTARSDGALLGPWSVFLHEPSVGQAHSDLIGTVTALKRLPATAKEVALLVTGTHFKAAYELYAHAAIAQAEGMSAEKVAIICAGQRPADLKPEEACAYDVAAGLVAGGVLPDAVYKAARDLLGQPALNELVLWIGLYAQVSIILNAFDVPSEEVYAASPSR